ncbi:MAG: M15 family metallopeptidase [Acidobacteriota bacterium]|nr:M15 family metallopeptidase [Acidobacteriota bacterium]MDH3523444.1 M15 family metallopeptidase [Acidobacteriota bacterium]
MRILPRVAGAAALGGWLRGGWPGYETAPEPAPPAGPTVEPRRDEGTVAAPPASGDELAVVRAVAKARDYDRSYDDDVWIEDHRWNLLVRTAARLERCQTTVGHGNFNRLGFEDIVAFARGYPEIGDFETDELELMEELFAADARRYGFLGEKTLADLSSDLPERDLERIAGTGHWLLRGPSLEKYRRIRRDLGERVLLTSGVRGLAKQYQLFFAKAVETRGNLSQAARSLAPPGYSFHAVGDFDIGKLGLGSDNFTDRFAETDEFKRLVDLGYVDIRYPEANPFGVRHEPWHIKIG